MPYRVLAIAPTSFFADYGCHVRILEEARALTRLGHQVTVCTYHNGIDPEGVRVVRMPRIPWHAEVRVGSHYHKLYFDVLLAARALVASIGPIDVVHAHLHEGALIGAVVAWLRRVPLVFDYQGSLTGEMIDHRFLPEHGNVHRLFWWLERLIERFPGAIVTSSNNSARLLTERYGRARAVEWLPDAVDVDVFRPLGPDTVQAMRARLGVPPGRDVVGYLGLLAEYQGVGQLLYAARQVIERRPNTHFLIMGYPGLERYKRQAFDLQIMDHVTFTGRVPYAESPQHLASLDVAVSAKLSETEANGKLLLYMAMGLPTVAYDTPVSRELLGDVGVYAPKGDVTALAGALLTLLDDGPRREALSRQSRERAVREFSWEGAAAALVATYDRLCKPATNPTAEPARPEHVVKPTTSG